LPGGKAGTLYNIDGAPGVCRLIEIDTGPDLDLISRKDMPGTCADANELAIIKIPSSTFFIKTSILL
jgi:hypothetical protein